MKLYLYKPLENRTDLSRLYNYMQKKIWWPELSCLNDPMEGVFLLKRAATAKILESTALLDAYFKAFQQVEMPPELNTDKQFEILQPEELFKKYRQHQPEKLSKELLRLWLDMPSTREIFGKCEPAVKSYFGHLGVICFTKNPNSIIMWAHYAKNRTGYCLEFEFNTDTASSTNHILSEKGHVWYDLKLISGPCENGQVLVPSGGEIYVWKDRKEIKCKLKNLDGAIVEEIIASNVEQELNESFLRKYEHHILNILKKKNLINFVSKILSYQNQEVIFAKVIYYPEKPMINEIELFECYEQEKSDPKRQVIRYLMEHSFFIKSADWAYEEEYRLISTTNSARNGGQQVLADGAPLKLTGIIMGESFGNRFYNGKVVDKLKQRVIQKAKDSELTVYSSKCDWNTSNYKMQHDLILSEN